MDVDLENTRRPRRRTRSIVFFDHGEPYSFGSNEKVTEKVKRKLRVPNWRIYLRLIRLVLQAIFLWFAVLTLGGLLLRGTGLFCNYSPLSPGFCTSSRITSQVPLLEKYEAGKTPTTKPLQELAKLNEISPSLQTLGLVMSLVSSNFSASYMELYSFSELYLLQKDELENLALATRHTQGKVSQFSEEEYLYRSSSLLWSHNGINVLGVGVDSLRDTLNETSTWSVAFAEHTLHRVPYGAGWSLARNLAKEYLYFVGEQELAAREMVIHATETEIILGDLLGLFGQLERKIEHVVQERRKVCDGNEVSKEKDKLCVLDQSRQLRPVSEMRAAVQWCQDAVKVAASRYKNLMSELSATLGPLRADMKGYRSVWPSKCVLSLGRLNETLVTEQAQIASYFKTAEKAEEIVESFSNEFLGRDDEDGDSVAMPRKLMEAIAKRELVWW